MFKSWLPYISYRPESIPESSKIMVFVLFFILWIVLLIRRFLKMSMEEKSGAVIVKIFIISFISVVFFSIFLTFTYLFTKPAFVYSERIWSPIIPGLILVFLSSAVLIAQPLGKIKNWFVIGLVILVLFLSRYYFLQSTGIANEIHEQGYGYTSKEIQNSGIINALEKLPKDMYLISNDPGLVLLYTNRMPDEVIYFPPYPFGSQNGSYELAFRQNHSALIILMDAINAAYGDKAQERLISFTQGLQVGFSSSIGNIYFNPSIEGK